MNPYTVLNISKDSNESDIKKAYRKLAIQHHPDKGGNADKFKEISSAYEILSNKQKKQQYDNFGSYTNQSIDPMNIFEQFFGLHPFDNDPGNITTNIFSGFGQSDPSHGMNGLNGLNIFLGGIGGTVDSMSSFSQTTYIKNGKRITKTTKNGNTTIVEEDIIQEGDPYTSMYRIG